MAGAEDWPIGRLLSTAARVVEHAWAERLAELGLTHAGLIALHLLQGGPSGQTELARAAHVQLQTMARTLERLERLGHVTRERDTTDARRVLVAATPEGSAAFERARAVEADVFPEVPDPEGFRAALLRIVQQGDPA
jgi:MarR family transcriptional regulator, organic hydroperoxide resistance regulator